MKRFGVDVGGTFTDLIYLDDAGAVSVHKVASTPADPSLATVEGAVELCSDSGVGPGEIEQFFHGTTVATNIILEHDGAEVGLITTKGFRDILHIARHKKPFNWSNFQDLPWQRYPLAKRRHRLPVAERIGAGGEVLAPLDEDEAREAVRALRDAGVEAIAVCFLFSFLNPAHEQRVKEIVLEEYPEVFLSVRHEVLPQYREYEGFSTVCLNAYVGPKVSRYVRALTGAIRERGFVPDLHLMTSAGGVMTAESAVEKPVLTLFSGPVAGLIGGIWIGRAVGEPSVITLDVGGTSADIGVAPGGDVRMRHLLDTKVGDYHAMIPMVEMDAIGAGGGSIAYIDGGGIFRVGPRSAGAEPGPACYGRGGEQPTATDCLLVLGRLPAGLLGGRLRLDVEAARAAVERHLAAKLGVSVEEAALAALQIQTHLMVQAIEENSVRRGYDPRDFTLVAFGGGGPLYACDIAQELEIPKVLVPPHPGITSAMGLLATSISYDFVRTKMELLDQADRKQLAADFHSLEEQATEQLARDGFKGGGAVFERAADCRYVGQGYELRIPVPAGSIDEAWIEKARQTFHEHHERRYYRRYEEAPVQIVNVRVVGVGPLPALSLATLEKTEHPEPGAAEVGVGRVTFVVRGERTTLETRYYDRGLLKAGHVVRGPAVIQQFDSTTVVNPGLAAVVDEFGNLTIDCSVARDSGLTSVAPETVKAGPDTELDPVTLRVIGGAFNAIAHEMAQTAMRMSFSSIIRESEDLGAGLFDAGGEELCESDTTPLQAGPLPWSIRGILARMRETGQEIEDGDVFIHNHPYHGASHSPDVMIAVPIFHRSGSQPPRHVAWSACVAHLLDIGGSAPGINPDSIDLWAEGKIYWALKLHARGERNAQLWRHIFDNVRTGRMNEGDVEALMSACFLGRDRFRDLVRKYGLNAVLNAAGVWKDYSESMLRREIEKVPDGQYEAPLALFDNDGQTLDRPLPIATRVTVDGSGIVVDLEGSSPEVPTGINVPFQGSTQMAAYFTVRSIFMDEATYEEFIPQNEGMFRPIVIRAPKGSLFNPTFPRSCFSRFPQLQRLSDNINLALAPVLGEKAIAGTSAHTHFCGYSGFNEETGEYWVYLEVNEGAYGGRYGKDAIDSVDTLIPNTRNNPIEELEYRFPLRCERYELRDEPAAPGRWRGGIGIVRENRFLVDGFFSCEGCRHIDPPRGVFGGHDGLVATLTRNPGQVGEEALNAIVSGIPIRAGDLFRIVAPNGGGFGDPCEREPGLVRDDVLDGFATPEQARRAYGVAFDEETLDVDMAETVALRAQLAEERERAPAMAPR
jgi:N-methylhydantoinase A/oxoprolinase/acetone carboxylase beta subunit/N-methylhydantoinase B/oxoprolinase/acetone carboxylase alpha subunit